MKKILTEERNPRSLHIDTMSTSEILTLMNNEDHKVIEAINKAIPKLSPLVDKAVNVLREGGRIFYVGAGTSGRLGVLDCVELIPTFSLEKDRFIGLLAGGTSAMFASQEGIEDNESLGAQDLKKYQLQSTDLVIGLAASGKTPYVCGALKYAQSVQATTANIVCTKDAPLSKLSDYNIELLVGPEVLTGSTRLKAGTAQKIALNMLSTATMIKLGKAYSNLMVDLQPLNKKLQQRAGKIFTTITSADLETADCYLKKGDYCVKTAVVMYKKGLDKHQAQQLLSKAQGKLKDALGEN